ncbi:MAG: RHS repeat-associated core domain-containing protein [Clostridia bacterium]|nr:RHS repeat-associated core domain-containing protein [Clostridia bacterium]
MKINKYVFATVFLVTIFLLTVSAFASTTDVLMVKGLEKYGASYNAPFMMPDGDIDTTIGAVNMMVADLTLPGKNGLDFTVYRKHNSFDSSNDYVQYFFSNHSTQMYIGVPYYVTINGVTSSEKLYIAYEDEKDIQKTIYTSASSVNNAYYDYKSQFKYHYRWTLDTATEAILTMDQETQPRSVDEVKEEYAVRSSNTNDLSIGLGWHISLPHSFNGGEEKVNASNNDNYYTRYAEIQFDDGKKEIVRYQYVWRSATNGNAAYYEFTEAKMVNTSSEYTPEMTLEPTVDSRGFSYHLKLTDREGKSHYFYFDSPTSHAHAKISAIGDRYGNCIVYEYANNGTITVTDTYGRKIIISGNGITVQSGDINKHIAYSQETKINEEIDPHGYYDTLHDHFLYVTEYVNEGLSAEKIVTTYEMKMGYFRTWTPINRYSRTYYRLNAIQYPTNARREYIYEETATAPQYFLFNLAEISGGNYHMYYVTGERIFENGHLHKTRNFSYQGRWGDRSQLKGTYWWDENKSFVSTETMANGHTKQTSLHYDTLARLMSEKTIYKNGNQQLHTEEKRYSYSGGSSADTYVLTSNIMKSTLRRAPIMNIMTFQDGTLMQSEDTHYYGYTRNPTFHRLGGVTTRYTYDDTFAQTLSMTIEELGKDPVKHIHTLTEDKKSIARTDVYEGDVLMQTISYTYYPDGAVASETVTDGEQTNVTEYFYHYADDNSYTATTAKQATDIDGNSRTVSVVTAYDSLGRLSAQTDGNGNTTSYQYNMLNQMTRQQNPDGSYKQISYDHAENNLTETDENGNLTTYDYSPLGNLLSVYLDGDSSKVVSSYTYDTDGRKTLETAHQTIGDAGVSQHYTYDDFGRVATITSKEGNKILDVETNTYAVKNPVNVWHSNGPWDVSDYDAVEFIPFGAYVDAGTLSMEIFVDYQQIEEATLSGQGARTFLIDTSNATSVIVSNKYGGYDYYLRGHYPTDENNLAGGVAQTVTTTYRGDSAYIKPTKVTLLDGYGNIASESYYNGAVSDANLLNKTVYRYDYRGNVTQTLGGRTYMEQLADYTTRTDYDWQNNPVKQYRADGAYTSATYDMLGNLLTETDYMGRVTTHTYDGLGRRIRTIAPFADGVTTETLYYYDNNGNIVMTKQQNNAVGETICYAVTEHEYDNRNRLVATKVNDGTRDIYTQHAYDAMGNMLRMVTGQTEKLTDLYGNLPAGVSHVSYEYDRFGNVIKETDSEGRTKTAEYTLFGQPIRETDKNGVVKETAYNAYGSPVSVTKGNMTQTWQYSGNNLLTSTIQGDQSAYYTYDKLGRMKTETISSPIRSSNATYTYDASGNRTGYTATLQGIQVAQANYSYDVNERLTGVQFPTESASYTYDQNGRLLTETTAGNTAEYGYNHAGLVTSLTNSNGADYAYTYRLDGNQIQKTDSSNGSTDYTYDGIGQLTGETTTAGSISYTYDTRGNRIGMNAKGVLHQYTYDTSNRLLNYTEYEQGTETHTNYTYDQNGNLIQRMTSLFADAANAGDELVYLEPVETANNLDNSMYAIYTYDAFGRLTGIAGEGMQAGYTYDINGRRIGKAVNGVYTGQLWDGDNVVAEFTADNTITNRYLRGARLMAQQANNTTNYYIFDAHGSVTAMDDEDYLYDAFGNLQSENIADNPFRYCGEYYDAETGMIYLRNRYYDPSIGRFITEDPARDGLNWYVYCGNNPIMFVDPWGLVSIIFVGDGMEGQAQVRREHYENLYNTSAYVVEVSSAKEFVTQWNNWFSNLSKNSVNIDAIEIISHGSIKGKVGKNSDGTAYSTGYLYFTDEKGNNLYAREIKGMKSGDKAITELNSTVAKELNINGCNGANPDTYNVVYAFMQKVKADSYSGFDGGSEWNLNANGVGKGDHVPGGGWYVPDNELPVHAFGDNWYLAKRHQSTFWKYVEKSNGIPIRERQGRRYFK